MYMEMLMQRGIRRPVEEMPGGVRDDDDPIYPRSGLLLLHEHVRPLSSRQGWRNSCA